MKVRKKCARKGCGKPFYDDADSGFTTCPECRHPLPDVPGGCTRYNLNLPLSEEQTAKEARRVGC
jgi:hypothetical protein